MNDSYRSLNIQKLNCIRQEQTLLANLSLQLAPGDLLLIEGPNGSGKSSLLRTLAGLATPAKGNIYWQGLSISAHRLTFNANMHYVGHASGIKTGLSVIENLRLIQHLAGVHDPINPHHLLTSLQLQQHTHTLACHLSAGQKRRLALARLFLIKKDVWLLDEPLTAIDRATETFFISQLEQHLQNGGIAVISTHHPIPIQYRSIKKLRLPLC